MSNPKLEWNRVHTFGNHTHLIRNGKTFCGRDVSNYNSEIHKNPTKKCKRCLQFAWVQDLPETLVTA